MAFIGHNHFSVLKEVTKSVVFLLVFRSKSENPAKDIVLFIDCRDDADRVVDWISEFMLVTDNLRSLSMLLTELGHILGLSAGKVDLGIDCIHINKECELQFSHLDVR